MAQNHSARALKPERWEIEQGTGLGSLSVGQGMG